MSSCPGPDCTHPAHGLDATSAPDWRGLPLEDREPYLRPIRARRFRPDAPSPIPFDKSEVKISVLRKRLERTADGVHLLVRAVEVAALERGDPRTRALLARAVRSERAGHCDTILGIQFAAVQNAALSLFVTVAR